MKHIVIKYCAIVCALFFIKDAFCMNGIPNIPAGYMCSETPTQKDEYDYWICDGQLTVCTAGSYCEENNTGAVACPTGKTSQAGAMTLDYCYYSDSVLIDFDSDNTVSEDILKTAEDAVEIQTVEIWEPNVINIQWKDSDGTVLESTTCEYGGSIVVPTTQPTRVGYTFTGWKVVDKSSEN